MDLIAVTIRSNKHGREQHGRYCFGRYSIVGRLMYGIKSSMPFILLSTLLLLIPGESFFYALFFLIFVPYQAAVLLRLKIISMYVAGPCPHGGAGHRYILEPNEHLPVWKYCPIL